VLLPFTAQGTIDEAGFRRHLERTLNAGLRVAVNMDTGYGDLLTPEEKQRVLGWTQATLGARQDYTGRNPPCDWFVAGAMPAVFPQGAEVAYARECAAIAGAGGVPILFPTAATAALDDAGLIRLFTTVGKACERFLAFELGPVFNPHGRLFSEPVLRALLEIPQCRGLKHSSLNRATELTRLALRDALRPEFVIYTGNDLAADMVEYGSDYLLGLSTFHPELFAARDRAFAAGEACYLELRDLVQYLGWLGFRPPVPAYKHSAAMFLKLGGHIACDDPHPRAPRRDGWDRAALADAAARIARGLPRCGT